MICQFIRKRVPVVICQFIRKRVPELICQFIRKRVPVVILSGVYQKESSSSDAVRSLSEREFQ